MPKIRTLIVEEGGVCEFAALLGVTTQAVYSWIQKDRISLLGLATLWTRNPDAARRWTGIRLGVKGLLSRRDFLTYQRLQDLYKA